MEVKSTGLNLTSEMMVQQAQKTRVHQEHTQGSVDTSSRKAESVSHEAARVWSEEELTEKVDALNQLSLTKNTSLQFEKYEKLDRMIVRVVDRETEEVIKEIPPEEFLDMISSMLEFAGLIIDTKI